MSASKGKQKIFIVSWNKIFPSSQPKVQIKEVKPDDYFEFVVGRDRRSVIVSAKSQKEALNYLEEAEKELHYL
jgi:hypothetical protein